ncbi:MAG: transketolase family protein [Eubacteriaceae bacterium]|nr:transketolase family protein [Eubacteriaceae bacterium]
MAEMKATRDAYGEALTELGRINDKVVVFDADLSGSTKTSVFKKEFPQRHFNAGIAENNMTNMAAGMAACGKIPFISTFAVFGTGRNYDALRSSVCYPKLNVKCVMSHAGLTVGEDGATHEMLEDVALMNALPNMTVIVPADATETRKAVLACADIPGPVYIRVGRAKTEIIYGDDYDFVPGKAHVIRHGSDIAIFAMGIMVAKALQAADILKQEGIDCSVVNVSTIKPLDREAILAEAEGKKGVITCEEHSVMGGLNSVVCQTLSSAGLGVRCVPVAVMDVFGESGTADELLEKHGLTADGIAVKARELYKPH